MRGATILATIAAVPLVLTPHLLFYYDVTPKIAILLIGVALVLLLSRLDLGTLWSHRASRWFICIVAFQWIWFGLATALSMNPAISLNGSTWRRLGFITQTGILALGVLCLAWLLENPANIRLVLRVVWAVGLLISVYTIAQYFGIDPLLPSTAYQAGEGSFTIVRPPGTLGHADYAAAWLLFVMFCSPRWIFPVAGFALLLTGTRSAILGLVAGVILLLLLRARAATVRERWGAATFVALLGIFFLTPAGAKLRARVHWSLDDLRGGARLLLWRDTLPMIAHHPLAGLGPETFGTQFPLSESLELARAYPDFYHESPHDLLLDIAAGEGLPAAIAFLGLCCLAAWAGIRSNSELGPRLLAALAALSITHVFVVLTVPTELAFYLLFVMLISLGSMRRPTACSTNSVSARSRPYRLLLSVPRYAVAIILLLFAVRCLTADYFLARAHQRITAADVTGAAIAFRASLWWQPRGSGGDLSYSRQMANLAARSTIFRTRLDAFHQALESGILATEESEQRQNAWFNLAELFAAEDDAANAERSLRNAISWAPNWFKPHWVLAQLLETQHHTEEAQAEAQAAIERDGGRHPEVKRTWTRLQSVYSHR